VKAVEDLPQEVVTHPLSVPMPDGPVLAGQVWRPVSSDRVPVPVVLELIPYRQRDLTSVRDSVHHPYMAGHGYACVRLDLRGSGDSEGVLTDEYLAQEQEDAEEVLAWLGKQAWSTGRAGMMGISWGGFNALQLAARRPPGLEAIVAASSSDDRYADDVHYMGGCLLTDNLSWSSVMFSHTSSPPDPAVVGDAWRDMWRERLDASSPWLAHWLEHQRRDDYWRHGSVCEDYGAIRVPVMAVSGWADGYSNAVLRMLENLDVPRQGLIGPWSHKYPHLGEPGPAIGFLQELVRWWDRWLGDDLDNGVMDEPMLRVWMQDSVPPQTYYDERPGRWVAEPVWPSPGIRRVERPLAPGGRLGEVGEEVPAEELTICSPLGVGRYAGKWCSYSAPPDLPADQRPEDAGSLTFDTAPLTEPCEMLGTPVVELEIAADRPQAMVAVRLGDVAPDGSTTRISYGLLNLAHRDGHAEPTPLEPGEHHRVAVPLNGLAQSVAPGHRLRVSVSSSYWPLAWPSPERTTLTVVTGASTLVLPVRPARSPEPGSAFGPPEGAPAVSTTQVEPAHQGWTVGHELASGRSWLEVLRDGGVVRFDDIGLDVRRHTVETYDWTGDDVDTVRGDIRALAEFSRGSWRVSTVTRTVLTSDAWTFHLRAELDAYEGDERVAAANWRLAIPRDGM
jgi:uncharacterized protein